MLLTRAPGMGSVWGDIKSGASSALGTVEDATVAVYSAPFKVAGGVINNAVGAVSPGVSQAFGVAGQGLQSLRPQSAPLPASSSSSNLPIYLGAGAAALVLLLLLTRKRSAPAVAS